MENSERPVRIFPLVQASAVEWKTFSVDDATGLPFAQCCRRDPITLPPSFEQKAQHFI